MKIGRDSGEYVPSLMLFGGFHRALAAVDLDRFQFILVFRVVGKTKVAESIFVPGNSLNQRVVVFAG